MNTEIKNMTEEQITDLKAQIADWEKAKERKPLVWKPKRGDKYVAIDSFGDINFPKWDDDSMDKKAFAMGNCFKTKELAEAELKRRQVVRQIEELVDKYDPERGGAFGPGADNYTFKYDVVGDSIDVAWGSRFLPNPIIPTCSSKEIAYRILEEVGEDNIKLLFMKYPIVKGEE